MIVAHNRRWLAEADRQGWSLEDVTLLFGSLDPGDGISRHRCSVRAHIPRGWPMSEFLARQTRAVVAHGR